MLKGGMVGFGFIASSGHFPAYAARKDVEIVAFADVCPARLDAARALAPGARFYATHEEMLAGEKALDFVDIATPPAFHRDVALAALRSGDRLAIFDCPGPACARRDRSSSWDRWSFHFRIADRQIGRRQSDHHFE